MGHHGRARFSLHRRRPGRVPPRRPPPVPLNVNPTYDIAHAHNIFLQTALDVGLPGLIVYLALLLLAFGLAGRWRGVMGTLRPFALGLLAGFAALHIYGLTDALALGSKTGLSFWVALGLLTAMHQIVRQTAVTQPHLFFQMRQRLPQIIQRPIQPLCSRFIRVNVNRVG